MTSQQLSAGHRVNEGGSVPEQKFFDPTNGAELVSVHWDFGLTSVDVAFGGTLLTKISDIGQLRATGMAGATPDGGSLLIRLGFGDSFEVYRNGEALRASDVNAFGHSPAPAGTALGDVKLSLDAAGRLTSNGQRVDEHAMGMLPGTARSAASAASAVASARSWLLFFSIVQTLFAALCGFGLAGVNQLSNSDLTGPEDSQAIYSGLLTAVKGIMLVLFIFVAACAVGSWVLWKVSRGPSVRKAFTISKWVAAVYLGLSAINLISGVSNGKLAGAIAQALIGGAIEFAAFQSFRKAENALPRT
jgi:hypothetical protein